MTAARRSLRPGQRCQRGVRERGADEPSADAGRHVTRASRQMQGHSTLRGGHARRECSRAGRGSATGRRRASPPAMRPRGRCGGRTARAAAVSTDMRAYSWRMPSIRSSSRCSHSASGWLQCDAQHLQLVGARLADDALQSRAMTESRARGARRPRGAARPWPPPGRGEGLPELAAPTTVSQRTSSAALVITTRNAQTRLCRHTCRGRSRVIAGRLSS